MMQGKETAGESKKIVWVYALFVLVTSFFTYFYRYNFPPNPFWDEPYHIASAQKYLNGVHFMEPHPPLGKLFIALGEKLVRANEKTDSFISTDYAKDFGQEFSFAGYRFFPSLFGWLSALVFFSIFFIITRSSSISSILSFLYIFDNAHIVHSRSAMLDSTLTFFSLLTILLFLLLQEKSRGDLYRHCVLSAIFGFVFACALATKVVALVLVLLVPAIVIRLIPDWRKVVLFTLISSASFFVTYVSVWQIHFSIATKIVPELADKGYYQASDEYKNILDTKQTSSLSSFPVMFKDSLRFVTHYSKGVPRLDLCKSDENGSPAYFWPFGARTINYRWEKSGESRTRYMYLVSNPVAWALGLLGVLLAASLFLSRIMGDRKEKLQGEFAFVCIFLLYIGYMVAISRLTRVMYMYHYFLPLEFSFILFAYSFINVHSFLRFKISESIQLVIMTLLGLAIFASFQFFRPLSYYEPLTNEELERRVLNPLWELHCVGCEKISSLVVPRKD